MKLEAELVDYIEKVGVKYPELSRALVIDILTNIPKVNQGDGYELALFVQQKLGLNLHYFTLARKRESDIKAHVKKVGSFLFVRLDKEIRDLLNQGYICCKTDKEDAKDYDVVIQFSKNTLLGFYK